MAARPVGAALVLDFELQQTVEATHRGALAQLPGNEADRLARAVRLALDVGQRQGHADPPVAFHQPRQVVVQRADPAQRPERVVQPADRLGQEIGVLLLHPLQRADRPLVLAALGVDVRFEETCPHAGGVCVARLPHVFERAVEIACVAEPDGLLAAVVRDDSPELVPGGLLEPAGARDRLRPVLLLLVDVDELA